MTHLQALYDAVKAGDRMGTFDAMCAAIPADHLSLFILSDNNTQAAIDFVQAVLPEYAWSVDRMGQAIVWDAGVEGDAISFDATVPGETARALLLAALAAMIAKGEG